GEILRDAVVGAGGFDAGRFPAASSEDVDLGRRLSARGRRIVLDGDLQGTHLKAWSVGEMIRTDVMRRGIPWVALLARERALPAELNLGWRHRAGAALSLGAVAAL